MPAKQSFPIDGVEVAIERHDDGWITLHGYLITNGARAFALQTGRVKDTGDSYRIAFPNRVDLSTPGGRTDER